MRLVEAAPIVEEEVVAGHLDVLALFSATVKKSVSPTGKQAIAGCKVCANMLQHWPLGCCDEQVAQSPLTPKQRLQRYHVRFTVIHKVCERG